MAQKRLLKEIERAQQNLPKGIMIETVDDNVFEWKAFIIGPQDTAYAGFIYELRINYPNEYPFKPPKVQFATIMFHPNIAEQTGEICLDILADKWAPGLSGQHVLLSIQSLLAEPNADDPLNPAAATLYKTDKTKFMKKVELYGKEYSMKLE